MAILDNPRYPRLLRFTRLTVLNFAGNNLALSFIAHELADGRSPPYVHLVSTRPHSRDRCSQAFPVFTLFDPLPCIILNENWRTKKRGRPGNEATLSAGHWRSPRKHIQLHKPYTHKHPHYLSIIHMKTYLYARVHTLFPVVAPLIHLLIMI